VGTLFLKNMTRANYQEILKIIALVAIALVVFAADFYWDNLRGAGSAFGKPRADIVTLFDNSSDTVANTTDIPLMLPAGFNIEIFAKNLDGARVMQFDGQGNMWVSRSRKSVVTLLEITDGKVTSQNDIFRNLQTPHGLAIDPDDPFSLYIAEESRVSKVRLYSDALLEKIIDLPKTLLGGHTSRTIGFGPDGRLYVSIGSTCNVCVEKDQRFASIFTLNKNGGDFQSFAKGLRNSVFFAWNPVTNKLWATEMGRDQLGDDIPPDEVNIVEKDKDYGWPYCYGKNNLDPFNKVAVVCSTMTPSVVDLQAHSAPLGIDFVAGESWPEDLRGDAIVAFHGSWNRSEPTGYKLVRLVLDNQGNYIATQDFITGWLQDGQALGRPAGVKIYDNAIYVSDDFAGVIYRIWYSE
jgi:glucose/arabinose dehydrogenase